jgi:hypothetical protein
LLFELGVNVYRLNSSQAAQLGDVLDSHCIIDPKDPLSSDLWMEWLRSAYEFDRSKASIVSTIVTSVAAFDATLAMRIVDEILSHEPAEFLPACFFVFQKPSSQTKISVPSALRGIAQIEGSFHGWNLGLGELALLFMVEGATCSFGGRDDISFLDEKWHVKKIEKNRPARMGTASATAYNTSELCFKLSAIDRQFGSKITNKLLKEHENAIVAAFGSVQTVKEMLREECLEREFSACAGVCVFDPSGGVVEFFRKEHIDCVSCTQGRYEIKVIR